MENQWGFLRRKSFPNHQFVLEFQPPLFLINCICTDDYSFSFKDNNSLRTSIDWISLRDFEIFDFKGEIVYIFIPTK